MMRKMTCNKNSEPSQDMKLRRRVYLIDKPSAGQEVLKVSGYLITLTSAGLVGIDPSRNIYVCSNRKKFFFLNE